MYLKLFEQNFKTGLLREKKTDYHRLYPQKPIQRANIN